MTEGKPSLKNEHRKSNPHSAYGHFPISRQLGYNINNSNSHCFAVAKAAGRHQQLGQGVDTQPLRCRRTPAIPGARKSAATLLFKMLQPGGREAGEFTNAGHFPINTLGAEFNEGDGLACSVEKSALRINER